MSLIDEFGSLYLASRLERLSEQLKKDAVRIFTLYLPGVKYKWYPVLYILHKKKSISVVELASELSYAHPTIIDILKELENEKLVKSVTDRIDNRRRLLSLTAKGDRIVQQILPLTRIFKQAADELIDNTHHLLKAVEEVEEKLMQETFFQKVGKIVKTKPAFLKEKKPIAK